jgi:hypothetical protein
MVIAIQLNNQFRRRTEEIRNIGAYWLLPAKAQATEFLAPQQIPKLAFGICRVATNVSRKVAFELHAPG